MNCYCAAPSTTGDFCTAHLKQLRRELLSAPGTLRDLDDTITNQTAQGAGVGGGERNVFNEHASYCADDIRHLLRSAAHDADPEMRHRFDETPAEHVARAVGNLQALARRPGAHTIAQDLTEALKAAHDVMNPAPEKRVIGTCTCGVPLRTSRADGDTMCQYCGSVWDVAGTIEDRETRARNVEGTPAEVAAYFTQVLGAKLTAAQVREWASRGLVHSVGERGRAKLYRMGEVMTAWEVMRRKDLPGKVA